jgi:magnesium transporter
MRPDKYLKHLIEPIFETTRTKEIFSYNPIVETEREEAQDAKLYLYNYDASALEKCVLTSVKDTFTYKDSEKVTWINVDGLVKSEVEGICNHFGVHNLLIEDILSVGQRPKMDDIEGVLFCLMNMLYFNEQKCSVEQEQISLVLGNNFILTFQEEAHRDVFNGVREKLAVQNSRLRQRGEDYLFYTLIDTIVDHYFTVMEKLVDKIEDLEEEIIRDSNTRSLAKLNNLRKELIVLKRNVTPVRDLINGLVRSESELLNESLNKYIKDVYDHIIQANETVENYRDILTNLQDLYISQVNLKMNEVMKVMAIVTCLLAPGSVIGGIFGMNFDVIPYSHQQWGFYITVGVILIVPMIMLVIFKRRGWF